MLLSLIIVVTVKSQLKDHVSFLTVSKDFNVILTNVLCHSLSVKY
jgi:membrane protein CcdC involved in cytochrome C biogenesis